MKWPVRHLRGNVKIKSLRKLYSQFLKNTIKFLLFLRFMMPFPFGHACTFLFAALFCSFPFFPKYVKNSKAKKVILFYQILFLEKSCAQFP